jgi:hypothetical protein
MYKAFQGLSLLQDFLHAGSQSEPKGHEVMDSFPSGFVSMGI